MQEAEVDHCGEQPCENGGTCFNVTEGRVCLCLEGFRGENCSQGIITYHKQCLMFSVMSDYGGSYSKLFTLDPLGLTPAPTTLE